MDAANPSAIPTFASRTPLHIGAVGLVVRNLDGVAAFYRDVLGLEVIERSDGVARLGTGGVAFLELEERRNARPDDNRTAGLYHTAFLMPTRADLARWVLRMAANRTPITGASDHLVSEAIYLDDPEGNGVEVYSDRPAEKWLWPDKLIEMTTDQLDFDDLVRAANGTAYEGAPGGLRIGHVHLRVGDVATAEKFYLGGIGLDLTRRRHGASFMSSGHYHHHVAGNVWHSAGAGRRDEDRAGLGWFSIECDDVAALAGRLQTAGFATAPFGEGIGASDPWGTRVRIVPQQ
jgi:catechol 2,3-dioxygenase